MIEQELLDPPELMQKIREFEQNDYCIDCQTVGHFNWDAIRKIAMNQLYVCGDCPEAVALVEFAHDCVRVLKQGLAPRYPKNFQHWIDQLVPLQTGEGLYDSIPHDLHDPSIDFNDKVMKKIMEIKDKKVEFSFCKSRPEDVRRGGKGNVEVPEPCKSNVIIHNHPSGSLNQSENDKKEACANKSALCIVTPEATRCYAPCSDDIISEFSNVDI